MTKHYSKPRITYMGILFVALIASFGLFFAIRRLTQQYDDGSIYGQSILTVSPEQFSTYIGKEDTFLVDVRTGKEFNDGHIQGARYLDPDDLDQLEVQLSLMDPTKTYVMYCYGGRRSLELSERMLSIGFGDIVHLDGGFKAWVEEGYPYVTSGSEE